MTTDINKFRVTGVKDFVGTVHSKEPFENSLTYYYVATLDEAKEFARKLSENGAYQSEFGGERDISLNIGRRSVIMPNPNIAVIECWDDDEREWFFYNDENED